MSTSNGTKDFNRDVDAYMRAWTQMMKVIWTEKMARLNVVSSGSLIRSISGFSQSNADGSSLARFKFLQYGYYVDAGTGTGFTAGNGGQLDIMDRTYRIKHRLDIPRKRGPKWGGGYTSGEPRKPKPWFNAKWFSSTMTLKDDIAKILGDDFRAMTINTFLNAKNNK